MVGTQLMSLIMTRFLVFSYIGYLTQEIPVGNNSEISATFVEDLIGLDEVVVIGYGSIRTADVTSAVVSVKPEDYTQGACETWSVDTG